MVHTSQVNNLRFSGIRNFPKAPRVTGGLAEIQTQACGIGKPGLLTTVLTAI